MGSRLEGNDRAMGRGEDGEADRGESASPNWNPTSPTHPPNARTGKRWMAVRPMHSLIQSNDEIERSTAANGARGFFSVSPRLSSSIEGSLENEPDKTLLASQPGATKGAGSVEGVGAVRQWDL